MKKKNFYLTALTLMLSIVLMSCNNTKVETPAEKLIKLINKGVEKNVIMFGHQDATAYGHTWKYEESRSDVMEVAGDYPAVMGWDLGALELGKANNLDGVPFDFMREEIRKQHARGGINTISWHAYTPDGADSWMKEIGIVTSILEGGENYAAFQGYLKRVAVFLASLKDEQGNLIPILFRPWHEHDGNWFWWGEKRCSHEEYLALWNMTYDYMQNYGLDNLVWVYMPVEGLEAKMPAADRHDMYGIDTYQHNENPEKYMQETMTRIDYMKMLSDKYNKPIALTETGFEGVKSPTWWTDVLNEMIKGQPISYVLVWRNAWDRPEHFYGPFVGHESEENFKTFVAQPEIILAKEVQAIMQ